MEQDILKFEDLIQIIKKKFKIIAFIVLSITVLAAVINFYFITPVYRSVTELFVGKNSIQKDYDISDIQAYQKLLLTYEEVIKTDDLIEKALEKNDLDVDLNYVSKHINVEPKSDTQIIEISYEDTNEVLSKDILEAVTNEFISYSKDLIPDGTVKIVEKAKIPTSPISPRKAINIMVSFVLGVILSISAAILLEVLDKTIKTKEQIEKLIDIPVIGVIPMENKMRKEKKKR